MRKRIESRRFGTTIKFRVGNLVYYGTVNTGENDQPMEVFLTVGKPGSDAHTLARDVGIIVSLLLQYGCPISHIQSALTRDSSGKPDGPLGILLDLYTESKS